MKLNIVDINAIPIKAVTFFEYRGHTISASTVFRKPDVWTCNVKDGTGSHYSTIEAAIEAINLASLTRRTEKS
jgi:hypothetical protein